MARLRRALPAAAVVSQTIAIALMTGCGGGSGGGGSEGSNSSGGGGTITLEGTPANDHGTTQVTGDSVAVELGDYYFEPTILVGKPGAKVKLELTNNGELEHNINADVAQVGAAVPLDQDVRSGGGKETVEVKFPDTGQLVFFCKYHEGDGMVGALRAQ
jgi:plastocyanin